MAFTCSEMAAYDMNINLSRQECLQQSVTKWVYVLSCVHLLVFLPRRKQRKWWVRRRFQIMQRVIKIQRERDCKGCPIFTALDMGKGANSTETNLTESEYQLALRKIFCNHMWKLNAGRDGPLLLGMEIALPHVISHAKALLSTFTQFASFALKRIHGGIALLGRWIHFQSLTGTDGVRTCEISLVNTVKTDFNLSLCSPHFTAH